jgi:hypothetical protein
MAGWWVYLNSSGTWRPHFELQAALRAVILFQYHAVERVVQVYFGVKVKFCYLYWRECF